MNQALLTHAEIRAAAAKLHISQPGGTTVLARHFMIVKSLYGHRKKGAIQRQLETEITMFMVYQDQKNSKVNDDER